MARLSYLRCRGGNIDIPCGSPPSASQGHTGTDESAPQAPPSRHTLLPLFLLCDNQLATSPTLQPSNFYSPSILTFLRFGPRLTLSSIARGLCFFFLYFFVRLGRESLVATGGKRKLTENPPLTSILASPLTLLLAPEENFKELQKRWGSGRLVNIRGHQPGLKQDHSVCKG